MTKKLKKGDDVEWHSHGATITGKVMNKIAESKKIEIAGRQVRASTKKPQYLVMSNKTGRKAVHKLSALNKK